MNKIKKSLSFAFIACLAVEQVRNSTVWVISDAEAATAEKVTKAAAVLVSGALGAVFLGRFAHHSVLGFIGGAGIGGIAAFEMHKHLDPYFSTFTPNGHFMPLDETFNTIEKLLLTLGKKAVLSSDDHAEVAGACSQLDDLRARTEALLEALDKKIAAYPASTSPEDATLESYTIISAACVGLEKKIDDAKAALTKLNGITTPPSARITMALSARGV